MHYSHISCNYVLIMAAKIKALNNISHYVTQWFIVTYLL